MEKLLVNIEGKGILDSEVAHGHAVCLKPLDELKLVLRAEPFCYASFLNLINALLDRLACKHIPTIKPFREWKTHQEFFAITKPNAMRECERTSNPSTRYPSNRVKTSNKIIDVQSPEMLDIFPKDAPYVRVQEYPNQQMPNLSSKKRKVRIDFSEQEKLAIKAGIGKVGKGKWRMIKHMFPQSLSNRTPKSIRVRKNVEFPSD
jgi:hypothetical protein